MKKQRLLPGVVFCLAVIPVLGTLASCTDFFSTSLASWAKRDPASLIPTVTTGNVKELIVLAEKDPDLSLELLKKIKAAADRAGPAEAAALRAAGLKAGTNAVDLGSSLINNITDIADVGDMDQAKGMLSDAINDMPNLAETSAALSGLIPDPSDTAAFDAFTAAADLNDLAMAAVILLAAEAKASGNSSNYISNITTPTAAPPLVQALAAAAKAKHDAAGGGGLIGDLLEGLGLV
jgi:hypothetical protein